MLVATILEIVNITVTPVLEGVVVEVAVFPKVVVVIGRLHWHIRLLGQPVVELWYSLLQLYWLL